MIRFDLRCRRDHHFEAWFRDNAAYEAQAAAGGLSCPICGSAKVEKAIMAPRVAKSAGRVPDTRPAPVPIPAPMAKSGSPKEAQALRAALEQLRDHVEATCDDVGEAFPEEARKIHYGEAEARGIYGQASEAEAEALAEEGVEFSRLPLPRRNS
ncbi:MAG: DUF1178 family protein [Kiloniellales bacterium]|nr:DUF1178 family protein [Kiloniellales bacterium]